MNSTIAPDYAAAFDRWVHERKTNPRRARGMRRIWSIDRLPVRAFMFGPKWKRLFDVREVPVAEVDRLSAKYHRPGKKLLVFTLEEDIRERVQVEIRPGVFAEWSDPREQLGISA